MNTEELKSLKSGDSVYHVATGKTHVIREVEVKDFSDYVHASFSFVETGEKTFCCTHCNGSMWKKG